MRRLLDNLPLKLTSLGLALMLWFAIAGEKTSEVGLSVPVELQNVPLDMELTGEPVNTLDVRLRGSRSIIQQLGPGQVSAEIDLIDALEGEQIEHLTESSIRAPVGLQVVKITPAILTLHLERTLQKTVPIHPRLIGKPTPGFEVADTQCSPPEVLIAGPKSRVRDIESAFTEPVSIDRAQSTVVARVNVGLEDPILRIHENPRVRVTVYVREAHEKRAFDALAVTVRGEGASVTPPAVRVTLTGPASLVSRLVEDQVRPYVELPDDTPEAVLPIGVEIAPGFPGITVHQIEPTEVRVRRGKSAE